MATKHVDGNPPKTAPKTRKAVRAKKAAIRKDSAEEMTSKADLIRKVAGIIRAKGEKPRPSEIVKILKEEGVTVAPAQVSMTLKAAGYRPLRKRRTGTRATTSAQAKKTNLKQNANGGRASQISMDDLLAAKSVSGAFGGTDKAIAVLQALKQFES